MLLCPLVVFANPVISVTEWKCSSNRLLRVREGCDLRVVSGQSGRRYKCRQMARSGFIFIISIRIEIKMVNSLQIQESNGAQTDIILMQ